MKIPILDLKPAVDEIRSELDEAYARVLTSGWFLLGRELEAFESEYAASIGVRHCIGVANGLEALQMVLMAAGIGPGDEVIVPSNGYIATWLAVTHVGARPVPCEPNPDTYNLDPTRLPEVLTPRTKAILPIHLYGQPADMSAINAFAAQHGLFVLEDGAQSHGAKCRLDESRIGDGAALGGPWKTVSTNEATPEEHNWINAGALGHAAGISFYPSKNLGALADGGAVTTNDSTLDDRLRHLRNYGSKHRYENELIGINSRLSELQAAFLRVKLPRLPEWNRRRKALANQYTKRLRGIGDLVLPNVPDSVEPAWHLYVIRTKQRDALQSHLLRAGIGTQVHYPTPPHLSAAYRNGGWKRGDFPVAERLASEVLSLPLSPHHPAEQIEEVCEAIGSYFRGR